MRLVTALCLLVATVTASKHNRFEHAPPGVDQSYDCLMRQLALVYGQQLQPNRDPSILFDALELDSLCGVSSNKHQDYNRTANERLVHVAKSREQSIYVDFAHGSDEASGSIDMPLKTIREAVQRGRRSLWTTEVILREGFHFLDQTITLTPEDNYLLITNYPGETAVVSGGVPLSTVWQQYDVSSSSNIWVADLSHQNIDDIPGLQIYTSVGEVIQRGILARYPNSNPEFIPVTITGGATWLSPTNLDCNSIVISESLPNNYPGMFQNYYLGVNGSCDVYELDASSYWCQPNGRTAGPTYCARYPQGMSYDAGSLPNAPYADASQMVLSAWRGNGAWFNWFWNIESYFSDNSTFIFGKGGFQGGEGSSSADEWYVQGAMEDLDWPTEYFYNRTTKQLYYYNNATGAPPANYQFVATSLFTLFNVLGESPENPVVNVTFSGLNFSTTAVTVLQPHGVPSGGDWALERLAAITFEYAENCVVESSMFTKLDGNAIAINGYNRGHLIQDNEFVWIGNNAVTSWGYTDYWNATSLLQPYNTSLLFNFCHEIGHYEKQVSCWFQAKSAQNILVGNIGFNMPRAAINFNDGFGGGTDVSESLLFNTCRESTDHGAINSWDREPFLTLVNSGEPSYVKAYDNIHHNFIVTNYGADGGCVDSDDGSSYYNIYNNYCVYGGHKSDFNGHNKRSYNNIHVYPFVYETACMSLYDLPIEGSFNEGYWNNTCILPQAGNPYVNIPIDCSGSQPLVNFTVTMGNNRVYAPGAQVTLQCQGSMTFQQFEAQDFDAGTVLYDANALNFTTIIQWGRDVLGIN